MVSVQERGTWLEEPVSPKGNSLAAQIFPYSWFNLQFLKDN